MMSVFTGIMDDDRSFADFSATCHLSVWPSSRLAPYLSSREAHLTSLAAGAFDGAGEISAGAQMSGVGRSPGQKGI